MPMDRSLYPDNWDEIALAIKQEADWHCEDCGRPCRRPGESVPELIERLEPGDWIGEMFEWEDSEEFGAIEVMKPGRFTLTVAHLNHRPEDCRRENLKALCAPCHCRMDLKAMGLKRQLRAERQGQLTLGIEV